MASHSPCARNVWKQTGGNGVTQRTLAAPPHGGHCSAATGGTPTRKSFLCKQCGNDGEETAVSCTLTRRMPPARQRGAAREEQPVQCRPRGLSWAVHGAAAAGIVHCVIKFHSIAVVRV